MPDFTLFEIHFHEFNPTNTAPFIGRGGASREVGRGGAAGGANLDGVPVEEAESGPETETESGAGSESRSDAETADDGSGGPGAGLVVALALLVVAAVAARKLLGGDDEFEELSEIDDAA